MAIVNGEKMEALVRKAKALRTVWLQAREEHRMEQLAANVKVRRVWVEAAPTWARQSRLGRFGNTDI
jgi:hypothetical protein